MINMIGIYKLENKVNGKIYIGQSIDIEKRIQDHRRTAFNKNCKEYNRPLYRAIRKYGFENFSYIILEECTVDELDYREIYYIEEYDCLAFGDNQKGYNMAIGGNQGSRGRIKSKEERRKISENREYKWGAENPNARPVIFDGIEYGCVSELCEKLGRSRTTLNAILNGNNTMPIELYVLGLRYKDVPMCKYTKRRDCISRPRETAIDDKVFNTLKSCAEYLGVKDGTLQSWISGKRPMPQEYRDRGLRYIL